MGTRGKEREGKGGREGGVEEMRAKSREVKNLARGVLSPLRRAVLAGVDGGYLDLFSSVCGGHLTLHIPGL